MTATCPGDTEQQRRSQGARSPARTHPAPKTEALQQRKRAAFGRARALHILSNASPAPGMPAESPGLFPRRLPRARLAGKKHQNGAKKGEFGKPWGSILAKPWGLMEKIPSLSESRDSHCPNETGGALSGLQQLPEGNVTAGEDNGLRKRWGKAVTQWGQRQHHGNPQPGAPVPPWHPAPLLAPIPRGWDSCPTGEGFFPFAFGARIVTAPARPPLWGQHQFSITEMESRNARLLLQPGSCP